MNKNLLKKFATDAREELRKKIEMKAEIYYINKSSSDKDRKTAGKEGFIPNKDVVINSGIGEKRTLSNEEKFQRDKLIEKIQVINKEGRDGFNEVIEEVAYTWFNRFIALRFMEVNNYIPTRVRVLSSNDGSNTPEIIKEANNVNLPIEKQLVYELKIENKIDELYRYLIKIQCDELNKALPFMFEKIGHYTELLFPNNIMDSEFFKTLINTEAINEEDWRNVEIIGWMYQYYISDEKDRVIKAKKKYKKNEIPFATQLFTPDWIVRYMVQNSLGRYWVEAHTEDEDLKNEWEFYLENPNKEDDFDEKLAPYINKELKVEDIKCFDPACGSGHILIYMFEVLYKIYEKCGYMKSEIPKLIIENNLYGLDIDDRAYQLACFAVIMKGMEYNNLLVRMIEKEVENTGKYIDLNLASIQETNEFGDDEIEYIAGEVSGERFDKVKRFIKQFNNAKIYGSLTEIIEFDEKFLIERAEVVIKNPVNNIALQSAKTKVDAILKNLIKQTKIMTQMYDVLVTNPPYIGNRNSNSELRRFLGDFYPDVKSDIFASFMKYSFKRVHEKGHIGLMTPNVWMFISSYEDLRDFIIDKKNISSMVQLSTTGFADATVHIVATTFRNSRIKISGEYIRLEEFNGVENQSIKTIEAVKNHFVKYRYSYFTSDFSKVSGKPIAYWAQPKIVSIYEKNNCLEDLADIKPGIKTGKNEEFLRLWHEVSVEKIGLNMTKSEDIADYGFKWFPYNKGGAFRKWYGNRDYIINFEDDARDIKNLNNDYRLRDSNYYFKESITWTFISSSKFGVRYSTKGFLFDLSGSSVFAKKDDILFILGFLCSELTFQLLRIQNPTLNFQVENIKSLPIILPKDKDKSIINKLVSENINISKRDWDSYENSWDFKEHPLLIHKEGTTVIEEVFSKWNKFTIEQFNKLKKNEEELNRIFIDIYGLQNEMTPDIKEEDVTIRKADKEREIKSFLSYFIGCLFGRYSLDKEGLEFVGGQFNIAKYEKFKPDEDNIIPLLNIQYFEDDIISKFEDFLKVTFGEKNLAENIEFIADTLGKKGTETSRETIRRYFMNDFFSDHCKVYRNRPIYWFFTSGKQKAFNCIIYMHRYDKSTLSRMRTDYVHTLQNKLEAEMKDLLELIDSNISTKDKRDAKKHLNTVEKQIDELKKFHEKLHHMADMQIDIDLDDGVVANYDKFKELVEKIK